MIFLVDVLRQRWSGNPLQQKKIGRNSPHAVALSGNES